MLPHILSQAGHLLAVHPKDGTPIEAGKVYVSLAKRVIGANGSNEGEVTDQNRVVNLEAEAAKVCDWLHSMVGLVEPEPGLQSR